MEPGDQSQDPQAPMEIIAADTMPVTIRFSRRVLRMHQVAETELGSLVSMGNSLNRTFFGITVGALIGFGTAVLTVDIADPVRHATFVGLAWASGIFALYFGIRAILDHRALRAKLREIKSGNIDSLTTTTEG